MAMEWVAVARVPSRATRGKHHLPQAGGSPFGGNGQPGAHALPHHVPVGTYPAREPEPFGAERAKRHQAPADHIGKGGGNGRALHPQPGPENRNGQGTERQRPAAADQQHVPEEVTQVHKEVYEHGHFGIAERAQDRTENNRRSPERHGQADNAEVVPRQGAEPSSAPSQPGSAQEQPTDRPPMSRPTMIAKKTACWAARLALSRLPAPSDRAMHDKIPTPVALSGPLTSQVTEVVNPTEAEAVAPNWPTMAVSAYCTMVVSSSCRTVGQASAMTETSKARSNENRRFTSDAM